MLYLSRLYLLITAPRKGHFFFLILMTTTETKTDTFSLMQQIIDEVLTSYKASKNIEGIDPAINSGFQKALDELHKISF